MCVYWCQSGVQIKCKWKSCVTNISILTKHRSIEYTRTIQWSCLHRSGPFDYNRSIVYFRSAKPARAEFSNFYHLVSYALPPYFIVCLFVCFGFFNFSPMDTISNTLALEYANFVFFLFIYLSTCSNLLEGFFALASFSLCLLFCFISSSMTFFVLVGVFMSCYLLFSWILDVTHDDNIWECFRFSITQH